MGDHEKQHESAAGEVEGEVRDAERRMDEGDGRGEGEAGDALNVNSDVHWLSRGEEPPQGSDGR
ncbi:hypothetical protein [Streptomyces sp. NPDC051776]|uniref:hypothetical protein n=1 Tax=Streptomyces sp. NPDC051776 TaxID=3155414 RepID=UPI0034408995